MIKLTPFGKHIRKLRVDHDQTMSDMAEKIGLSSEYLSAVERGKKRITANLIDCIARHFLLCESGKSCLLSSASQSMSEAEKKEAIEAYQFVLNDREWSDSVRLILEDRINNLSVELE